MSKRHRESTQFDSTQSEPQETSDMPTTDASNATTNPELAQRLKSVHREVKDAHERARVPSKESVDELEAIAAHLAGEPVGSSTGATGATGTTGPALAGPSLEDSSRVGT